MSEKSVHGPKKSLHMVCIHPKKVSSLSLSSFPLIPPSPSRTVVGHRIHDGHELLEPRLQAPPMSRQPSKPSRAPYSAGPSREERHGAHGHAQEGGGAGGGCRGTGVLAA